MSKYYDITEDLKEYPDCWCYLIVGGRGTGKTYSTLKYVYENKIDFVFLKRTMDDVDTLAAGYGKAGAKHNDIIDFDLNPFSSINRDLGCKVTAAGIRKGIAGFWEQDGEGNISGAPLGYIFALNGVTKYKGFDLASSKKEQYIIFDEFIPNVYDKVSRKEGLQLLDFYKTVSRDRVQRGLDEIKLICLSNATDIGNPVFDTLEVMDSVAEMQVKEQETLYIEERGIFIRKLKTSDEYLEEEAKTGIYRAMQGTAWHDMSYGNDFSYNDFSNVDKQQLKYYTPVCSFIYKRDVFYLYKKEGHYYMTYSKHNGTKVYNLNRDNEVKKCYNDIIWDLCEYTTEDRVRFESYSMYDLVINYRKIFGGILR